MKHFCQTLDFAGRTWEIWSTLPKPTARAMFLEVAKSGAFVRDVDDGPGVSIFVGNEPVGIFGADLIQLRFEYGDVPYIMWGRIGSVGIFTEDEARKELGFEYSPLRETT